MAQGFTLELKGLQQTLNKLQKVDNQISKEVDAELLASALNIESKASKMAPVDTGRLRNSITYRDAGKLRYEIVAQTRYAPYVEFGTGKLVQIPAGLETYAAQFKGKGIRQINRSARPFMFPALFSERKPLLENIKKVLTRKR
jgi:HK97 gp10 family phage protein